MAVADTKYAGVNGPSIGQLPTASSDENRVPNTAPMSAVIDKLACCPFFGQKQVSELTSRVLAV